VQDKNTEKCVRFSSVQNAPGEMKKIRDVAAAHIDKPLSVVPVLRNAPSGESIVCTYIPRSARLLHAGYFVRQISSGDNVWLVERGEFELPVSISEQPDKNMMPGFAAPRRCVGIV
jgi:hypothetical protein